MVESGMGVMRWRVLDCLSMPRTRARPKECEFLGSRGVHVPAPEKR